MRNNCLKSTVLWLFFISFDSFDIGYFIQPCNIACTMQHAFLTPSTYPGSCTTCFFCIPVFGGKSFLIFTIICLTVHLKLICIIGLSDLDNPLISAKSCPGWHNYSLWGFLFFTGSWLLNFTEWRRAFFLSFLWPFRHYI